MGYKIRITFFYISWQCSYEIPLFNGDMNRNDGNMMVIMGTFDIAGVHNGIIPVIYLYDIFMGVRILAFSHGLTLDSPRCPSLSGSWRCKKSGAPSFSWRQGGFSISEVFP